MIKSIEIIIGLVMMIYAIKFMISLCKPVKIDLEFIGFMFCFIGLILMYCLFS